MCDGGTTRLFSSRLSSTMDGCTASRPSPPSGNGTRTAASPVDVSPIRTPSRLTTRLVWMFSPMMMNGGGVDVDNGRSLRWVVVGARLGQAAMGTNRQPSTKSSKKSSSVSSSTCSMRPMSVSRI